MNKRRLLRHWAEWSSVHYGKALLIVLGITILLGAGFTQLEMEMTFFSVMPRSSSQVQDLERITEEFPFASQIIVVVKSDPELSKKTTHTFTSQTDQIKQVIDALDREFSRPEYSPLIESVYSRVDRDFIEQHGMMLMDENDLERFSKSYSDLNLVPLLHNLNNDLEREYSGDADSLEDDEDMAAYQFKALEEILRLIERASRGEQIPDSETEAAVDDYLYGERYLLSTDEQMGLLFLLPTFTINDIGTLKSIADMEERAGEIAAGFGAEAGFTGMIVVGKDEMVTSEQGLAVSMVAAFVLVITLLILAFRMNSAPMIAGIPLLIGILWTIGATGLVIHRLNIMTAMYMIALIGLGIDYAIHLLATYIQARDSGMDFYAGISHAYKTSGPGVITGALTTAAAFLALTFSKTDMVSELGVVAGIGILCEMLAMLMLIPPLLSFRHARLEKKRRPDTIHTRRISIRSSMTTRLGTIVSGNPGKIAVIFAAAGIILSLWSPGISVEDNIMNMEAKGLTSIELQDTIVEEFDMASDGLYILSSDIQEMESLKEQLEELETVASVDSIVSYYPSLQRQQKRIPHINILQEQLKDRQGGDEPIDTSKLLDEVFRLEMNLTELGDMAYLGQMRRLSPVLNRITGIDDEGEKYRTTVFDDLAASLDTDTPAPQLIELQKSINMIMGEKLITMADTELITENILPQMVRDSYISRDGTSYLMTIIPKQNPWEGDHRTAFRNQVETVTDRSTGMILAADQLTQMATVDGVRASVIALIVVFIILLLDFRNLKLTLLTFVPLFFSVTSLFGIMALTGIKFDFVNIIAIPLLIGIGIDDAVHIDHRYRNEGRGSMAKVIASTGTAVLLTTITTIIGFASFIPSIMRAMRSTGIVLSVAMALAFLYSVFLHPALLILIRERLNLSFEPWRSSSDTDHDKGGSK